MQKLSLLTLASVAALSAVSAHAATAISFTANDGTVPAYIGTPTFSQDFGTTAPNGTHYTAVPGETVTGTVNLYQGDVGGEAVGPANKVGDFLSILNGSYEIAFSGGVSVISFLVGGMDAYNSVTLNFVGGGPAQTLHGTEIIGQAFDSNPNNGQTGRVTYDFGGGPKLSSIIFGSSQPAFEIDQIVAAAPEPATWLMMILGFGLVGGALRRRRATGALVIA